MTRVLVFGVFDNLHSGHMFFLRFARKHGNHLTVVVTRDSVVEKTKGARPVQEEKIRMSEIKAIGVADNVMIGDADDRSYKLLKTLEFDVVVVGYDQEPSNVDIVALLSQVGRRAVKVIRCPSYRPDQYKSSLRRKLLDK